MVIGPDGIGVAVGVGVGVRVAVAVAVGVLVGVGVGVAVTGKVSFAMNASEAVSGLIGCPQDSKLSPAA